MASVSFRGRVVFLARAGRARKEESVRLIGGTRAVVSHQWRRRRGALHFRALTLRPYLTKTPAMATIHITRGTTGLGTFSEEEVREGLRTGRFISTDLGWREGMSTWEQLSKFPEFATGAPPPPPPSEAGSTITPVGPAADTPAPRSGLPW